MAIALDRPPASGRPAPCFHCGLEAPAGARFCCPGCEAISQAISERGLDDYYRLREAPAARARVRGAEEDLALYDDAAVQRGFVRETAPGEREADLALEGMRCVACAWLVEKSLERVAGVTLAQVNYATRRARVRWQADAARPSALMAAVRDVGYRAWPYDPERLALAHDRERRASSRRLWIAGLAMMQVMMYAVPGYLAGEGEITADIEALMRWAGLLLTLPVITYCSAPFFRGAWRDLRHRLLGMDVPVALGLAAAFGASAWATFAGEGAVYFDSVTMFVFLLLGGRHLELVARGRATASLSRLARLVPGSASRLLDAATLATETVPVARLRAGDRLLVRAGETLAADGVLESERAEVSAALLSGESRPATHAAGASLPGGAVNCGPGFVLRVTRAGADATAASIARLMERALGERPRWAALAARASSAFVAIILFAAAASGLAWLAIDPARALWIAVAVLIVTCPCALALATPAALTVATGALARRGVVVSRGHAIEALAGATDFVFDKTGTLTRGELGLREVIALGRLDRDAALAIAAAMGTASSHPIDRALVAAAGARVRPALESHRVTVGEGAEARVAGRRYRIGRATYAGALHGRAAPVAWLHGTDTVVWLADEHGWIAAFALRDALRPEARALVEGLRRLGVTPHLLSGDEPGAVREAGEALGIVRCTPRASPEAKREYVRALQARGRRVAMLGDGINDAPVLAQADVSIAMGAGADLAQVRADAVLLSNSLADLGRAVALARRARAVIRQNLAWAVGYNLVAVPLAAAGLVTPLVAGIGMSASSLVVVANALRARG